MDQSQPGVARRKGRREALWIILGVSAGLVVLVLLAVAAAGFFWVAPQFISVSGDTRESSTMTNLKTVRSQLLLYKAQHDEHLPDRFEEQMTRFTDAGGSTSATQDDRYRFGPYMLRVPVNPYTGRSTVTTVRDAAVPYSPAADMDQGWWYNSATGEFRCHVPDSVTTGSGMQVNGL